MKNELVVNNDLNDIYGDIKLLINKSKENIYRTVNTEMLFLYWNIGKIIVEIQDGKNRAKYGDKVLEKLSEKLIVEFGNGFSKRNLERMRKFYKCFPIATTMSSQLTWSHYTEIIKIKEKEKRDFYINECIESKWSVRELQRQIKSKMYDRMFIVENKNIEKNKNLLELNNSEYLLKDPYVLEFLKLKEVKNEKELENKIIEHLKEFLLELGKGFSLIGRQVRITIENNNYYPDLVFYNNITKNYLIIDLKLGKFNHKDIGQMQLYVNYYNKNVVKEDEVDTIGLILCASKNEIVVKYTIPKNSNIYVSKYLLHMPKEEDLVRIIRNNI